MAKNNSQGAFSKKIVVTGAAGFIGSNFINAMAVRYPEYFFIIVDSLTKAASLSNIAVLKNKNVKFEKTDIRKIPALEKVFKKHKPTDIIHFAAESHVDVSIKNPSLFVETNVLGTSNLLVLSRKYGLKRFHHVSTDEVYGSLGKTDAPFTESSPISPNNPYSASKAGSDLLVRSHHKTFGIDTVITRCSNNYGPHQDATKLIPRFITLLLQDKKVPLYSQGEHIREWIFVDDHVRAIDLVFHKGRSGEVYNVPGHSEHTNKEITELLLKLAGKGPEYIEHVADRPGHDFRYALLGEKIFRELGFKPEVTLEEGLKKTFAFYAHTKSKK
jgi:dTDP-glucose 4,6-dehydratase